PTDSASAGRLWFFTRSGTTWTQDGNSATAIDNAGGSLLGTAVRLSADGKLAVAGGPSGNGAIGASWQLRRTGGVWAQSGAKLIGSGGAGTPRQGSSVALSSDGGTVATGAVSDAAN